MTRSVPDRTENIVGNGEGDNTKQKYLLKLPICFETWNCLVEVETFMYCHTTTSYAHTTTFYAHTTTFFAQT